jgi:Flp pilus assembly protein CpaB
VSKIISTETMTIGIVAILFGLAGAYGVRHLLMEEETPEPEADPAPQTIQVPMASNDLPADRVIAQGDMASIPTTTKALREKGYELTEIMMNGSQIVGRRLREPVEQGEPFLTSRLYLAGTGPSITERLKPGFRAVTLEVPGLAGRGVGEGSHVDLLFRTQAQSGEPAIPEMTFTLLENVEVLELVRDEDGSLTDTPVVTLAVPAEDVKRLEVVEGRGEFSLAARPDGESIRLVSTGSEEKLTLEDVLGIEPQLEPVPEEPFRTVIYRRGVPEVVEFPGGQRSVEQGQAAASPSDSKDDCKTCGKKKTTRPMQIGSRGSQPQSASGGDQPTLAPTPASSAPESDASGTDAGTNLGQ